MAFALASFAQPGIYTFGSRPTGFARYLPSRHCIGLLQGKQDYSLTGWSGLTFLLILVVTSGFLYHRKVRVKLHLGKKLHVVNLIFFLVFQQFTFPALLFYLKSSLDWEKSLYSQHYTQSIREVFPWCALPFVFIGFYWDWLRNHSGLRNPKYDEDW